MNFAGLLTMFFSCRGDGQTVEGLDSEGGKRDNDITEGTRHFDCSIQHVHTQCSRCKDVGGMGCKVFSAVMISKVSIGFGRAQDRSPRHW